MSLFARKSVEKILSESSGDTHGHALKRTLGATQLIALGIGAIIGAGIFSLTGVAAAQHAGPAVVYSFILAAIGCAFAGLCYAEFSTMIPIAGSAYTYAYATMGELLAWIIGWALVLEYAIGNSRFVLGAGIACAVAGLAVTMALPREIMPPVDRGEFTVRLTAPGGTPLAETISLCRSVLNEYEVELRGLADRVAAASSAYGGILKVLPRVALE